MKVYLSGSMSSGWQDKIINLEDLHGVQWINPKEHKLTSPKNYTNMDLLMLGSCDIIFAYLEKDNPSGIGLTLEIGASLGKRITILVDEKEDDRRFDIVRESCDFVFDNIFDAISCLIFICHDKA